jgi:hypothetical protein
MTEPNKQFIAELQQWHKNSIKTQSKEIIVLVITHRSCTDGAGASWTIDKYYRNLNEQQNEYKYVMVHHRIDPNQADKFIDEQTMADVMVSQSIKDSRLVFSADVGYNGSDLVDLYHLYPNMVILDHHISSYRDILKYYYFQYLTNNNSQDITGQVIDDSEHQIAKDYLSHLNTNLPETSEFQKYLPNNYYFDNNESGTTLTWKYFNGTQKIPMTLQYIRDRDIWKFELPDSENITIGIYEMIPNNPPNNDWTIWDKYIENEEINLEKAREIGTIMNNCMKRKIWGLYRRVMPIQIKWNTKTYVCGAINTTEYISDLGNFIVSQKTDNGTYHYDLALIWYYSKEGRFKCSFRSREKGFDVGALAKYFNGGGHQPASGCVLDNIFPLLNKTLDNSSDTTIKINNITNI